MNAFPYKQWFEYPKLLQRFTNDLVFGELAALRPTSTKVNFIDAEDNIALGDHGLEMDSLELMGISTSLARSIHIHESHLKDNFLDKTRLKDWQSIVFHSLEIFSERISFKTSGSTGLKKYCTHQLEDLEEEAQFLAKLLPGRQRILLAIPSHHIYGFIFSILLPRYLNPNIEIIDVRALSSNTLISIMASGDLVLGFPEFWKYIEEAGVLLPADVIGVNSAGPCLEQIGLSLLNRGLSKLFEVYGASETAGIGWRDHPSDSYKLFPFWEKQLLDSELKRVSLNGQSFIVHLHDRLHWFSSNKFNVIGRKDDIVQIGGINVSLHYVRDILKTHPAVKDASVRMMRPVEGNRLKAFIVFNDNGDESQALESLNAHINLVLLPHERPKSIKIGSSLATNKMGKLCDWSIDVESH
ncbi:AMP-binding enzyme [Methylotenera versatilis]|uniref:4-coumarate--CoA ligase n=1 Tax=Methylotenera versatilis (strain 301) TaxID=666681 RepID=D7DKL0_METV0|nr:4-coumarate--CoA ligase [Methylotenera versatilis]ADI30456.1 4-coumarate--CoA ligase [Methylotenera versatilis 301]